MVSASLAPDFSHAENVELSAHQSKAVALDWNCTGDYLAAGSASDTTLLTWKLEDHGTTAIKSLKRSPPRQLAGVKGSFHVAWHPKDPERLVTLEDAAIRFWDHRSGKITSSVVAAVAKNKKLLAVTWAPNGHDLVATSINNYNLLVDSRKSAVVKSVHSSTELNQAAISPDGTTMIQGMGGGEIQVLDFPSLEVRQRWAGHMERVVACRFDQSGRLFVTGSHDSTATVWDYDTLLPIKSHCNADWAVNAVSLSHDSQWLATGGDETEIKISNTHTGAVAHTVSCHGTGYALSWNPRHMLLAYCGREEKPDRTSATGQGYVNVFAPGLQ